MEFPQQFHHEDAKWTQIDSLPLILKVSEREVVKAMYSDSDPITELAVKMVLLEP